MKVKKTTSLTVAILFAVAAGVSAGALVTFTGSARWTSGSYGGFTSLERLGVMKSAEQNAVLHCQQNGNTGCVATGSQIGLCDDYACEADAVASVALDQDGTRFEATVTWTNQSDGSFQPLEQLGVMKSAEQGAVQYCQKQGLRNCAPISSQITSCDSYSCQAYALAASY